MVSIGNGSVLLPFQLLTWKTAVCCGNSHMTWHSAEASEPQHHLRCPDRSLCLEAAGCLWKSLCGVAFLWSRQGLYHAKEHAQHGIMGRCLWVGLTPIACRGHQHGQHFHWETCYTPNRPALSSHFPETAVSGGSGTQVGIAPGLRRQFESCVNISG